MLTGQHYTIGVLIAEKYLEGDTPFYWHFFRQILAALKHKNYIGTLEIVTPEEESARTLPSFVKKRRIDGLIVLGQFSNAYLSMITGQGFPCAFLDFYSDIGGCDCFVSNNVLASCNLTKMLLDKGHTNIAFVGSTFVSTGILDRYLGYSKAMHEAGLVPVEAVPHRNQNGEYYKEINPAIKKYTALVCANDKLAALIVRQLRRQGIAVPDEISIVGFDNADTEITCGIGVTSVRVNIAALCEAAVNSIVRHAENADSVSQGKLFVDAEIIEKSSVAAPRKTVLLTGGKKSRRQNPR